MVGSSNDYQYNKLRTVGGSHRLTLVKGAVDDAVVDVKPPRPTFAFLPAAQGTWVGFDIDHFDSQRERVHIRAAITDTFDPDMNLVGEYPVDLRGKVGSTVARIPSELVQLLELEVGDRITTISLAKGALLFVREMIVQSSGTAVERAIGAARMII